MARFARSLRHATLRSSSIVFRGRAARGVGFEMNLYTMVGSGVGSLEATALGKRLATWHDAMVAHERKIRAGRTEEVCDDECPHTEAQLLWAEAMEIFGDRAQELKFLRSRATASTDSSTLFVRSERSGPATVEL